MNNKLVSYACKLMANETQIWKKTETKNGNHNLCSDVTHQMLCTPCVFAYFFFFFSSWTRLAISKSLRATVASPFFFLPFCSTSVSFSFYGFSHFHCNSRHISLRFMRQPRWKPETKQQTKQKCDRKKRINKTTREKKIRKNVSWRGKKW